MLLCPHRTLTFASSRIATAAAHIVAVKPRQLQHVAPTACMVGIQHPDYALNALLWAVLLCCCVCGCGCRVFRY
jgi:hypothetical protein